MNFRKNLWLCVMVTAIAAVSLLFTTHTRSQGQGNGNGDDNGNGPDKGIIPHRTNPHDIGLALTAGTTAALSPISNHGGPVIQGTVHIYIIWYGNWNQNNGSDTPSGQQIIRDFANSIGNSNYFDINKTYPGVTGAVTFVDEATDTGSRGTRLKDADIKTIVNTAINSGALGAYDPNGVYFVLTSSNVSEQSGFCTRYCGWHTAGNVTTGHVRYSFVGNANRCLSSCAAQSVGPNGNAGVDGMISVIAHELEEAVTDPDLNAWYDSGGAENADKCAWTFGGAQFQVNGAWANMTLGSRNYLIQRNLKATDNKCYVSNLGQQ